MPRYPFFDMGPAEVTWAYGVSGEEQTLSPFLGPIVLRITDAKQNIEEEGFGSTPVDAVLTGSEAELEIPMTRNTLAQLAVITHGELDGAGNLVIPAARVGCPLLDDARPILLRPVCANVPSVDVETWVLIYYAYPIRSFELSFSRDAQRTHLGRFMLFPSFDSGTYGKFWQYGLST